MVELVRSQLIHKESSSVAEQERRTQMSDVSFCKIVIVLGNPFVDAIAKQRYADLQQE